MVGLDSFRSLFGDPPNEFRLAPLWHLNGELMTEEIRRQLVDAKAAGFGGVLEKRFPQHVRKRIDKVEKRVLWKTRYRDVLPAAS